MKKRFTILAAACALLAFLAIPMGMRGQTGDTQTVSYGWETTDDATLWTISDAIVATSGEGNTGTYAGKINTNSTIVQFNEKVYVTSFSYAFKRTSNNNNYSVYIETSTDGSNWSIKDTQAMNTFTNGSYRTVTKEFDGTQELYVRFRCNNTTAIRYVDDVTITYATSAAQLDPCDFMLTNASTSIVFDLYNNSDPYVINYTTSSTGEVTVADSDYITTVVDQTNKTITVTPVAVTNGAKVITVNQAADDNYAAGSKTFTINITDSTPFAGGDVTFDATVDKDLGNVEAGEGSITKLGVTFACSNGILGNGTEYRMYKNSVTTFSVSEGTITQIAFTGTSNNPASGFATQTGWTTDGNNGTWTGSAQEVSFTASGAQVRATLIVVTVDLGGTPAPSINADDVNITYNATSGNITYTIDNAVTDGTMSVATESDWLTLGQGTTSPISFTCSANSAGTDRTATVTLTYTYNRATVTANVIVTQAGNPDATMTIAEVRAQGTGDVATLGTVTSITGTSNKTAYIQDATAAIVVYGNFTATVGDEIRVSGTLSDYNGLLEITNPVVTVVSSGNTINPELMTIAEINASTNQGWYVRVENATVTAINGQNTTIAQDDNTIVVRGISGVEYAVNDVLSLNGNIGYYNGNQIANPQNIEVQYNTEPSITITNDIINVPAEGDEDTIEVTYQNIIDITANVYFCDAEGNELEENPDWIYAEVDDDNNLYYNVEANDGAARTAYLKVVNVVGQTYTYSNLVTINQAQYVADYAILPFEFDGGRGDIVNTAGLTGYDLGSDYSSSPKLKFNNANETISSLILKFNEVPGPLTFDIKGNPSNGVWEGTFKVQTSEDGEIYTDLAIYTALTTTVQSESFDNLSENVRYIKWIYSEKVSGNVGVGNIHLYEFGGGPVAETYDLTIEPFENLEIFTFVDDELTEPMEGAGTIQVTEGVNVMLSVSAEPGYVMQSLMVDGVEHVNDIDEELTYTFVMPNHNVTVSATAVADVPFESATYTLVTSLDQIESGKTYIIVGKKNIDGVDSYYAMGEQRSKNRGGVAISVDGITATVETAEVHEFIIDGTAWIGPDFDFNNEDQGVDYSIYDTNEASQGYLYAASSSDNVLKTEAEPDENANWDITIDENGQFSIVAKGSNTRNVMQFNYNGGNTLFSCYASASQLPVYLYVKEEATTTVTQTIALDGTTYVSFYVDITLDDLKAAIQTALPSNTATATIAAKTATVKYNRGRWVGQLNALESTQMYKITVSSPCEIVLEGMPIDPTTLEVTIVPGANWIAYPFVTNSTPLNFFSGFAINDDQVRSKTQSAKYNRGRWAGQLTTLESGQGYIYISAGTTDRTFEYPMLSKGGDKGAKSLMPAAPSLDKQALLKNKKISNFNLRKQ